jgi:hypothetical protein
MTGKRASDVGWRRMTGLHLTLGRTRYAVPRKWSWRGGAVLASGVACLLCLSVVAAAAEVPRLVPDGQFDSQGAFGVTVDQSTSEADPSRGDVYVAGFFTFVRNPATSNLEPVPGRVNKFDATGALLSPPSPIEGAFGYSGVAVNPANGDVDAVDAIGSQIDTYDPINGEPRGSFPVEPSDNLVDVFLGSFTVVGIAADSAGNVYVPVVPKDEVLEYGPAGEELNKFTGGSGAGALKGPSGVALDPAGNLWVADTGNNRIEELSPAGAPINAFPSEGVQSVALDAQGDVFAIVNNGADFCGTIQPPCSHLVEYTPTGTQLADLGAGSIGTDQFTAEGQKEPEPDMVAVSDATGRVYVAEGLVNPPESVHSRVLEFRPPVAPTLEGETAVEVGVSGAKLGAVVNPGGVSASYRFEYGTTTAYDHSVPFPEGNTGSGFSSRSVWANASALTPGTTYHYRVVVTGALGQPLVGQDQTFTTQPSTQSSCSNQQFRTAFSASLPDCRAYELVTPPNQDSAQPDKNEGGNAGGELELAKTFAENRAAADGDRLSFKAEDVLPGSPSAGESYVATRGPEDWSEANVFPPTNYYGFECPQGLHTSLYSEDLDKAIVSVESGGECGVEPELVEGEPRGSTDLLVRDNATGAYQLVNVTPVGVTPAVPTFLGASPDYDRIVFAEEAKLTPDAPEGASDVYEWSAGRVHLVTVLGNGSSVAGSFVGISADGSRVFFTAAGALYARVDGAETVQLDASEAGGAGGVGSFQSASHDGSVVLFTADASAGLTSDTQPGSGANLYRYDFSAPQGQRLTDLTPVSDAAAPSVNGVSADGSKVFFTDDASAGLTGNTVSGSRANLYLYDASAPAGQQLKDLTPAPKAEVTQVLGVSEDGSTVYFKAEGVLTSQANQHGETAEPEQPNMYVSHGGAPVFIAINGPEGASAGRLRLSANGAFLAFESVRKLTAYDNTNPNTRQPAVELYLYAAASNSLACASCNPSGQPPTGRGAGSESVKENGALEERAPNNLAEDGRVFFDSPEGLLPADTNGDGGCSLASGAAACTDVYEFEPDGVGSCAESAGCLYLISTGTGSSETFFVDASPSGNDVFIREYQKLLPGDNQEGSPSLYDVRVDGGLPEPATPPACDTTDACRTAPAPQPAIFGAPASQTFSGVGNVLIAPLAAASSPAKPKAKPKPKKCRRGYVKKKSRCVKAKQARKARKSNRKGRR